ncbi:hypothetical protein MKX01_034391 [Papaver californicum]|nr:hypothetical protein MKX01_034391 [Papaver californicum]
MLVLLCVCFSYLVSVIAEVVVVLSDRTSSPQQQQQLLEWTTNASSGSAQSVIMDEDEEDLAVNGDDISEESIMRRALYTRQKHVYYISYGALSANRVPCPPRSGRSYYTNNCYNARQPAQPYSRGCSKITRCRR